MNYLKRAVQSGKFSITAASLTLVLGVVITPRVFATTYMTHATVMEYSMNASGTSSVAVSFTAGAADGAGSLTVNFGSWGGTVNATQTVTTTGCQALTGAANILPGSITAAGAGSVATVSSVGALTSGQSYCFILSSSSAVTNPSSTGVYGQKMRTLACARRLKARRLRPLQQAATQR